MARFHNFLLTSTALLALASSSALAEPLGGTVVGGSATISSGPGSVTVNQSSSRAIVNWTTFNIGRGETTTFNQPSSSSVVLNRVTGGLGPSEIYGTLSANGHVFLINRDGVLIGPTGVINTAGFLATTSDIKNEDFMAGRMNFNIPGQRDASIVNQGTITASTGGFAALVAPGVRNSGTITATLGTVALASGNTFTLDLYGDRLIQLSPSDQIASQVIDVATGKPLKSLVSNEGKLSANGGRVELTAAAARAVVDSVINNSGVIEANTVGTRDGKIVLGAVTADSKGAGLPKQTVRVGGTISAAGKDKGSKGGTVVVTGEDVQVAGARIDASGDDGGGKVMLGGDWGGGRPTLTVDNQSAKLESYQIATATTLSVDAATTIDASARSQGHGGKVVLWSDSQTTFAGTIFARGGENGGNGGFVEVSSKGQLAYAGTVDTTAPRGTTGTLLLDPSDVIIRNLEDQGEGGGSPVNGVFNPPHNSSVLRVDRLQQALATTNVLVTTTNPKGTQAGDITVADPVTWSSTNTLTLKADNNIAINAALTATKGGLTLQAENNIAINAAITAGGLTLNAGNAISATGGINVGTFTLAGGDWTQVSAELPAFSATDFRITGGSFLRATGGNGDSTPYQIVDIYGLQGIGSSSESRNLLNKKYILATDIDAAGTSNWNSGGGFVPIGSIGLGGFTGSLDGQNHTIDKLTIAPTNGRQNDIGLFGTIYGSVSNLKLTNVSVTADPSVGGPGQFVGALAGSNAGTITNVLVLSGTVSGLPLGDGEPMNLAGVIAGGLVGQNGVFGQSSGAGTIKDSSANVTVTVGSGTGGGFLCDCVTKFNIAGGLVGSNVAGSTITGSQASGDVTGGSLSFVGGLVGQNQSATISKSSASGSVASTGTGSQSSAVGGLVGFNSGQVSDSSASGKASGVGSLESFFAAVVGGLIGLNQPDGTVTNSHATGTVSGTNQIELGGLVGGNFGTITNSSASGNVNGNGHGSIGGLAGMNVGTITSSWYEIGTVSGSGNVTAGGLVGENSGSISKSRASGAVTLTLTGSPDAMAGGLVGQNDGTITDSFATGAVSSTGGDVFGLGGFVGLNAGTISGSYATGKVTASGADAAIVGGFAGGNIGTITQSHATGQVFADASTLAFGGGFVGFNFGDVTLSYATGNTTVGNGGIAGGFAGGNAGTINQAYARGTVTGGDNSYVGGFVGINATITDGGGDSVPDTLPGSITQAYALGPVTGGNAAVAAGFAALNLGTINQVYAVGLVSIGAGGKTGGLIALNTGTLPSLGDSGTPTTPSQGIVTNSYWDRQTTAQETSAGGTAMDTAVLAGGVPPGFDPTIWSHGSYPHLVNLGPQDTTPGPPALPPLLPPPEPPPGPPPPEPPPGPPPIEPLPPAPPPTLTDTSTPTPPPLPPTPPSPLLLFQGNNTNNNPPAPPPVLLSTTVVQQQVQQTQQVADQTTTASIGINNPTRLNAGDNRYFYLPPPEETRLVLDEVVIQMPCTTPEQALSTALNQLNLTILSSQCLRTSNVAAYRLRTGNGQSPAEVIRALVPFRIIASAQANYLYTLRQDQATQTQEGDSGQYVLEKLRLIDVHRRLRANNVPVAVIDSEVDAAHPDLQGAVVNRYDATGVEEKPHAHGTGMAGAIASHYRLLGIAPGAKLYAIRAFSTKAANAESTTFNILKGLDYAVINNVRIVNMSFAGPRDPTIERALKTAYDKGVILIAAAGNAGPRSPPLFPAADKHVIAVTATDIDDRLFSGANRGNYIAVSAPGVDILVPAPEGTYQMTTGTSVATAHVSGIVALMLERNPRLTPADVRRILTQSAKRLGPNDQFGAGLIDPVKALQLATPRSVDATPTPATTGTIRR